MQITYTNFPLFLFLSYDLQTAPDDLPFDALDPEALAFLLTAKGLNEMFGYITAKNSLHPKQKHTNYRLSDRISHLIDSDDNFKDTHLLGFCKQPTHPSTGIIILNEDQQYVYLLMDKDETIELKEEDGRYLSVAYFKENTFLGFEEAILTDSRGVEALDTGHYTNETAVGGYLSFILILLGYTQSIKRLAPISSEENMTTETIYDIY